MSKPLLAIYGGLLAGLSFWAGQQYQRPLSSACTDPSWPATLPACCDYGKLPPAVAKLVGPHRSDQTVEWWGTGYDDEHPSNVHIVEPPVPPICCSKDDGHGLMQIHRMGIEPPAHPYDLTKLTKCHYNGVFVHDGPRSYYCSAGNDRDSYWLPINPEADKHPTAPKYTDAQVRRLNPDSATNLATPHPYGKVPSAQPAVVCGDMWDSTQGRTAYRCIPVAAKVEVQK
jgi:hypothetical protein